MFPLPTTKDWFYLPVGGDKSFVFVCLDFSVWKRFADCRNTLYYVKGPLGNRQHKEKLFQFLFNVWDILHMSIK